MLAVLLLISVDPEKFELSEDCHFVIEPVYPDKVKTVLFVPGQTIADPAIDPPTLC